MIGLLKRNVYLLVVNLPIRFEEMFELLYW